MLLTARITPQWTETAEQAFGPRGKKGDAGEVFFTRILNAMRINYQRVQSDKDKQTSGIDFEAEMLGPGRYLRLEIKNNLQDDGKFFVYNWIRKRRTEWVFHVNPDTGHVVYYYAPDMRNCYNDSIKHISGGKSFIVFEDPSRYPNFVYTANFKRNMS